MLGFIAFEFDGSLYEIPNNVPINDEGLRSMPVAAFKEFVGLRAAQDVAVNNLRASMIKSINR